MLKVTIDGVDRSSNINARSLSITNALTDEVDSCYFEFETSVISEKPKEAQEIIIEDGTERVFAGVITSAPESEGIGNFIYNVECVDYQRQLDKYLVIDKYENMYAGDIVKDIINKYCPGFTTNNVEQGAMIKSIPFNYKYPGECIKELANLTGFHWYTDYYKDIHFFDEFKYNAPFSINDNSINFEDLMIMADISQLRNRVYFRGGTYLSDPFSETQTGGNEVWNLGYKPHDLNVFVNGSTTSASVGIENLHEPNDFDFLVNYQEKHVIPGKLSTTSSDSIKFTYRYDVPVITVQDDIDSIQLMKGLEGGDGIYEHIIVDKEVKSKELARQRSQADLDHFSNPIISGRFTTNDKGLRSGQLIGIKQTNRNIDNKYLISRVTMRWLTVDIYKFDVEIASKLKGIEELLIDLFGRSRQIDVRDDEVLDKLLVLREKVNFTDSMTYTTNVPVTTVGNAQVGYSEVS